MVKILSIEEMISIILIEVLGLEDEEIDISLETNVIDDLAAESIDFIDICFRLEKEFNIGKVSPGDIFPIFLQESDIFNDSKKFKDDKKEEIIERLLNEFPHLKGELIEEIKNNNDGLPILKVKNLVNFVKYRKENV